jgi:hypothetical protein
MEISSSYGILPSQENIEMGFERHYKILSGQKSDGLSRLAQTVHQIIATEQNASSEGNSFSTIHRTPRLLQNPKSHRRIHEIQPLNFILS